MDFSIFHQGLARNFWWFKLGMNGPVENLIEMLHDSIKALRKKALALTRY